MGMYDIIKDGVEVARNAGNIELSLELAKVAGDLLEKQKRIGELEAENAQLRALKKFEFPAGKTYLIDPEYPDRALCPVCTNREKTSVPLQQNNKWCSECRRYYK